MTNKKGNQLVAFFIGQHFLLRCIFNKLV